MKTPLCIAFVLCLLLLAPALIALPLSTQLSLSMDEPLLSQDPQIGQLILPKEGSCEAYTLQALGEPYSTQWIDRYVSQDVKYSFVRTFDQDLCRLLPQKRVSLGAAVRRQESLAVPFRYGEGMHYGTFTWIELAEGEYTLISISLPHQPEDKEVAHSLSL